VGVVSIICGFSPGVIAVNINMAALLTVHIANSTSAELNSTTKKL